MCVVRSQHSALHSNFVHYYFSIYQVWKNPRLAKNDYNNFHGGSTLATKGHENKVLYKKWNSGNFFTESKIDDGCAAMLTVKVFNNVHGYRGTEFEQDKKYCKCDNTCEPQNTRGRGEGLHEGGNGNPTVNQQYGVGPNYRAEEMSLEKSFMIIVGSIVGGVVFLIVIAIILVKLKNSGKFRRSMDGTYEG